MFSGQEYQALLRDILSRGYRVVDFADVDPAMPELVLRHDVDLSLERAAQMGQLEAELDVRAIYFVLLTSPIYNAMSGENIAWMRRILDQGHDIGLHFDATVYDAADVDAAAARECDQLAQMIDRDIRMVSFHRPAKEYLGNEKQIGGRDHAYQPRFFDQMGYCSDSRGAWHHGHPLDHDAVKQERALQLLTHPIWWIGEPMPAEERLMRFLEGRVRELDQDLAANVTTHVPGRLTLGQGE